MSEPARVRLARLSLPLPLEPMLLRTLGIDSAERRHEELVLAWEATSRVLAGTCWAVCRALGLRSAALDEQCRTLARPSFGHWLGLLRAASGLLAGRREPEADALRALLDGLRRPVGEHPALLALVGRLRALPHGAVTSAQVRTAHDLLQAMPAYRNAAQSTHASVDPGFRAASVEPLFEGLLALCELVPPLGGYSVAAIHRLERDEAGMRVHLAFLHGAGATLDSRPVPRETWDALVRGQPYLHLGPSRFVPLYPLAAMGEGDAGHRLGWLTGKVHTPTLAYQAGPEGAFQVKVAAEDYLRLLGEAENGGEADEAALALEPYKGLLAYQEGDEPVFAGREEETAAAVERLWAEGALVLCGASGSGKSSLMRAGVTPAVRRRAAAEGRDAVVVTLVPGSRPLESLRQALRGAGPEEPAAATAWSRQVVELLPESGGEARPEAVLHLLRGLAAPGRRPVLCVDQLEEVTTACGNAAERGRFLDVLTAVARGAADVPASLLVTVRADLVGGLLEDPGFRALFDAHVLTLGGIDSERLVRVVTAPLRGRRVEIEPGLAETIAADVGDQPGTLALLSQVMATLWRERGRHGYRLTKQAYDEAGRVAGALGRQAEEARAEALRVVPAGAGAAERSPALDPSGLLDRALLQLAHLTERGEPTRRRVALEDLAQAIDLPAAELRRLLEPFVVRRLLVLGGGEAGEGAETVTVEVAHEALLVAWDHLRGLLQGQAEAVELRQEVEAGAADWHASGRQRELWTEGTSRLERAEQLLAGGRLALTLREREFLAASRAGVVRRQRARRLMNVNSATLLLGTGVVYTLCLSVFVRLLLGLGWVPWLPTRLAIGVVEWLGRFWWLPVLAAIVIYRLRRRIRVPELVRSGMVLAIASGVTTLLAIGGFLAMVLQFAEMPNLIGITRIDTPVRAGAMLSQGDAVGAVSLLVPYLEAARREPLFHARIPHAELLLAEALVSLGDDDAAREHYAAAVDDLKYEQWDESAAIARRALAAADADFLILGIRCLEVLEPVPWEPSRGGVRASWESWARVGTHFRYPWEPKAPEHGVRPAGVLVAAVNRGSPAFGAGLRPGDVIQEVEGMPVVRRADLVAGLRTLQAGWDVRLQPQPRSEVRLIVAPPAGPSIGASFGSRGRRMHPPVGASREVVVPVQGDELLRNACERGLAESCAGLAARLERGAQPDLASAAALYRRACDAGDAAACVGLGWAVERGRGVAADPARAAELYARACAAGDPWGCDDLGVMLARGVVVKDEWRDRRAARSCSGMPARPASPRPV
jgi:hypothetical protein